MNRFPKIIEADGLCLRPVETDDMPEVIRQLGNPEVARWLAAVANPFGEKEADEFLDHSRDPGERVRLIESEGQLAGCLSLGTGLWYWLDTPFWGKGLMRRALKLSLTTYFGHSAPPLVATCREDNAASIALLACLGFSRMPAQRRMFFQGTLRSHVCTDYAMTSEQWHFLNPRTIDTGEVSLRPARQRDADLLARVLPPASSAIDPCWPDAGDGGSLSRFIEAHRYRGGELGLFVVEDRNTRAVGAALCRSDDPQIKLHFERREDADRLGPVVMRALTAPRRE